MIKNVVVDLFLSEMCPSMATEGNYAQYSYLMPDRNAPGKSLPLLHIMMERLLNLLTNKR